MRDGKIYDWDMRIERVDDFNKEYYTKDKLYEVRNGNVVLDKEYKAKYERFSLDEFMSRFSGEWIVERIKLFDKWYKLT